MKTITKSVLASCMTVALIGPAQAEELVYDEGPVVRQVGEYVGSPVTDPATQTASYEQWQQTEPADVSQQQTIAYEEEVQPQPLLQNTSNYDAYAYQEGSSDNYQQADYQVYEQASLQQPVVYEQQGQPAQEQQVAYQQPEQPAQAQQMTYQQPAAPKQAATAPGQLPADVLGERLLAAARAGNLGDVRWLLRKGADPEYKLHENALSPLDLVVKGGWVKVAQVFLDEGVNFNKRGNLGVTFLHQAAAAGKLPMVEFLVGAGVSPNTTTAKDWTALHHAARFGHANVVSYLLTTGANKEHRNSDGFRPRELAINARHLQIAQMF